MRFRKQHYRAITALFVGLGVELWLALMTYIVYGARPYAPHWIESVAKGTQRPGSRLLAPLAFRLYASYGDGGQFACFVLLCLIQGIIYGVGIYLVLTVFRYFSHSSEG
jgi:hypothetical protein